jgi:TPR repeat protein
MTNLGLLYVRGLGVPQDYVFGYMWINLAAAGGLGEAVTARAAVSARMTAAQIGEAERLADRRWQDRADVGGAVAPRMAPGK